MKNDISNKTQTRLLIGAIVVIALFTFGFMKGEDYERGKQAAMAVHDQLLLSGHNTAAGVPANPKAPAVP